MLFSKLPMSNTARGLTVALSIWCWGESADNASAQHHPQAAIVAPFNTAGAGFSEQIGVSFSAHGPNWFFQQNAFGGAAPPFGPANPGGGLSTGFGFQFPGGGAAFNVAAGQGATSSMTGSSASVTVMNGQTGGISVGTVTPFVMGVVPVVGDAPAAPWSGNPLGERLSRLQDAGAGASGIRSGSEAARRIKAAENAAPPQQAADANGAGDLPRSQAPPNGAGRSIATSTSASAPLKSVAEIKAQRAAAAQEEQRAAEALARQARNAEAAGKTAVAKIFYQQAARRATGALKDECESRAALLSATTSGRPPAGEAGGPSRAKRPNREGAP